MKKFITYFTITVLSFFTVGCSGYLDVNKNVDAPDYVDAYLYLAPIQANFQGYYWDIRAIGPITQMMSTTSYTTYASHGFSAGSDAAGEMWRVTYWNHGKNLENLIKQSEEAEEWNMAGIGYAIKALSWDFLTKEHGEVPLQDAFVPGLLQHRYDSQKDVFTAVRSWAYKAIECFDKGDQTVYGFRIESSDYIYKGDFSKWKKFAYAVLARNYIAMSKKSDFAAKYADSAIFCVNNSFSSPADDATIGVDGNVDVTATCNFWGAKRGNLSGSYFPSDYAVQVMTGCIPEIDPATKNWAKENEKTKMLSNQIITDTTMALGCYDPRVVLLIGTSSPGYVSKVDSIKAYKYHGGGINTTSGQNPRGGAWIARNYYGAVGSSNTTRDGNGRWIYRDDAPYILMTYGEMQFIKAEAAWVKGDKGTALEAFKEGVRGSMETTKRYIKPIAKDGDVANGDKINAATFTTLANQYLAGPYVGGLTTSTLTISHIMMQKWVCLYPWGAQEAWVDMRKNMYDLDGVTITDGLPAGGYSLTETFHKDNNDPTRVYKGFFLPSAQVYTRKASLSITTNKGAPCFRLRPRYNSEYMWNLPSLKGLKPIAGDADNYQCSIPWFANPNE